MEGLQSSIIPSQSSQAHLVDIHEEDRPTENAQGTKDTSGNTVSHNRPRPARFRDPTRKSIGRQVSLETGFSALRQEREAAAAVGVGNRLDGRRALPRSGRSFGGFGTNTRFVSGDQGMGGRKGDFNMFRTKSTLTKQTSFLPLKKENDSDNNNLQRNNNTNANGASGQGNDDPVNQSVPVGRYYAALTGPELDQVKEYEDILLPKDETWPFLLRFPIGCFGICLGLSSQAILWRALSTSPATQFLHVTPYINLVLWILALCILILVSTTYIFKCIFYFEAVKREYFHPVRVNFFFAPWLVGMFLTLGAPNLVAPAAPHPALFCTFMAPIFVLELKIYGQWLSGGKRRLSKVANPSSHLSVVGNFVGAILAAKAGWKEPAKFFWAVGFAHYLVVFVTLYQRLPTSEVLPKELHPVYSMFIAAPSAASMAWEAIYGDFDGLSRNCYFIALFLYISLVVRLNFFRGFRFSLAWWSYTFPMTTASLATIKYAEQVPSILSKGLALSLSFVSSTMVSVLFISTLLHAFVWKTLFPNDLAIAIAKKRQGKEGVAKKPIKRAYDLRKWAKQTPMSIVSSAIHNKNSSTNKDHNKEASVS